MKKLIFTFMLILMATMAFGQVTISGSAESGLKIVNTAGATTIQHFDWANGGTGWGRIKLNATTGSTSADLYIQTSDSTTLTVPYLWLTQKYFKDALSFKVGKIDDSIFETPYRGLVELMVKACSQ